MQNILVPTPKDDKSGTHVTSKQVLSAQSDNNPLNGLLSVSCAQISSHTSKDPPTTTLVGKILSAESIKKESKPEVGSMPKLNSSKRPVTSSCSTNSLSSGGGTTTSKTVVVVKKCDSNESNSKLPPTITGSLRLPVATSSRFIQSYLVCGTNGIKLVTDVLDKWKWHRLTDKTSTIFTLKWSDLRQSIDYHTHREGEQMVNHYPNSSLLTTKIGLLESLRQHRSGLLHLRLHINQVIPETYRMDVPAEREEFFQTYKPDDLWICKPTGANQGKGIFLVKTLQQLEEKLLTDERNCPQTRRPTARIVQRYLSKPLLLEGRKFDIRVFLLLVSGERDQLLAFYHHGYIRLSCLPYDTASSDMIVHLTNQYVQKKHPNYQDIKEDTVWDFDKFQSYLTEHEKLPSDWVEKTLKYQIKRVMLGLHHSVRHKLEQRIGYFELFGLDFMLDSDHHLWLIEVNVNPALHTNCDVLNRILPGLIEETLGVATEVWSKSRRSRSLFPIEAQKAYEKVYPL